eukprot:TRINITY_DN744_c0_g3_i1.p1 TRINITY_DN744_c0_g3~~TRINITY_DN744_c0_g3_i1.p1  ORF type:complete len:528 (-),score=120.21 TRINITY_DN744_c0_g3_i1:301-1884(-)
MAASLCEQFSDPVKRQELFWKVIRPVTLMILLLGVTFTCLGPDMMGPTHKGFALFLCWVSGVFGGKMMVAIGQPALLGMLIAGILLRNLVPMLVEPLPEKWSEAVRVFGLSIILMRSGLELDLEQLMKMGPACARLTVLPGCLEACMISVVAHFIFGMPFALSFSLGFILAAVSPAVVVGGMFDLQRRGYGVAKGIPSLVVAAASFDDVVAITGYSLCIGFAIPHEGGSVVMEALHGPINVGLGLLLGGFGGTFIAQAKLWNVSWTRTAACLLVGLTYAFGCNMFHYTGGGALASLVTTCVVARHWQKQAQAKAQSQSTEPEPSPEPADHDDPSFWAHDVEHDLAIVWANLAQPLLFCVIGTALNFRELDASVIPSSIIVVGFGVCMRCPVAFMAVLGAGLTTKERAFVGLAWIPKATVQAALGGIPLSLVRMTLHKDDPHYRQYEEWGMAILTTAVFSILITAPIGLLVIQNLGHRWLNYDGTPTQAKDEAKASEEFDPTVPTKSPKLKAYNCDIVRLEDLELCGF